MHNRKMTTSMERVFKKLPDGLIREITLHFIIFMDDSGNVLSSKLDKSIPGRLFKRASSEEEHSSYGEVTYTFPDEELPCRLLALRSDYTDNTYGRNL